MIRLRHTSASPDMSTLFLLSGLLSGINKPNDENENPMHRYYDDLLPFTECLKQK